MKRRRRGPSLDALSQSGLPSRDYSCRHSNSVAKTAVPLALSYIWQKIFFPMRLSSSLVAPRAQNDDREHDGAVLAQRGALRRPARGLDLREEMVSPPVLEPLDHGLEPTLRPKPRQHVGRRRAYQQVAILAPREQADGLIE